MNTVRARDRTPYAVAEIAAALVLVWASFRPWFVRGADDLDAWHAVDDGVALVLPPLITVATTFVGMALCGRSKWANPIAFALAGLLPTILCFSPGAIDYTGRVVRSAYGLWIEVAAAWGGLAISLADIRFAGRATVVSGFVGRPSLTIYVLSAVASAAVLWLALAQPPDVPVVAGAVVVLVAVPLAGPTWPVRLLAADLAFGLAGAWFMASTAALSLATGLVFVAGVLALAVRERHGRGFGPLV